MNLKRQLRMHTPHVPKTQCQHDLQSMRSSTFLAYTTHCLDIMYTCISVRAIWILFTFDYFDFSLYLFCTDFFGFDEMYLFH